MTHEALSERLAEALGIAPEAVAEWFSADASRAYTLTRMSPEHAQNLPGSFAMALRRSYVDDETLRSLSSDPSPTIQDLIGARLPDPGSTMAGDFGEILTLAYFLAVKASDHPFGPLKWRLKQDRRQPVPHSDLLLFVVPAWPIADEHDSMICAEVKTKSTRSAATPIAEAIRDSQKDRTGRLAKTLVWLQERSMFESIGGLEKAVLDRFCHASEYPPANRQFAAVAVVDEGLVEDEIAVVPDLPTDTSLVVIVIPQLLATYTAVFEAAHQAEPAATPPNGGRAA